MTHPSGEAMPLVRRARTEGGDHVQQRAFSPGETARALGISRSKVYELISTGRLPSLKIDDRRLVLSSTIDEFLAECFAEAQAD